MPIDSRIIHAYNHLSVHFHHTLSVRFSLDTYPIKSELIFDPFMALTPIAIAANNASMMLYGRTILDGAITPNPDAAFGAVVALRPDLISLDVFILIAAAENFFGISGSSHPSGRTNIDLRPLMDGLRTQH